MRRKHCFLLRCFSTRGWAAQDVSLIWCFLYFYGRFQLPKQTSQEHWYLQCFEKTKSKNTMFWSNFSHFSSSCSSIQKKPISFGSVFATHRSSDLNQMLNRNILSDSNKHGHFVCHHLCHKAPTQRIEGGETLRPTMIYIASGKTRPLHLPVLRELMINRTLRTVSVFCPSSPSFRILFGEWRLFPFDLTDASTWVCL